MTMVKELISSRNENYTFFVQCCCGQEIIQFYFYEKTNIDDEILGLRYFGHIQNHKNSNCANFRFNRDMFKTIIDSLKESVNVKIYNKTFIFGGELLAIKKDALGFYSLIKFKNKRSKRKEINIWDICIHKDSILDLIAELEEMFNYVIER